MFDSSATYFVSTSKIFATLSPVLSFPPLEVMGNYSFCKEDNENRP